jgi:hypothetical protein
MKAEIQMGTGNGIEVTLPGCKPLLQIAYFLDAVVNPFSKRL